MTKQPRATRARRAPRVGRDVTDEVWRRNDLGEETVPTPPSALDLDQRASAARTGHDRLLRQRREHVAEQPLAAGDVDASLEAADTVGDETPGGDNPTPDQDRVDDLGRALGVEYADDEELQTGDKIARRDRKRWELDPASSEDYRERTGGPPRERRRG